jgi:hypothetical protein
MTKRSNAHAADELFELAMFRWSVSSGGYCFAKGIKTVASMAGTYLIERSSETETVEAPVHDSLFREFSDLAPGTEPILDFAGKYGMLGVYVPVVPLTNESSNVKRRAVRRGESISTWHSEIATMYRLVRVWDSIVGKIRSKHHDLEQWVNYLPDRILYGWKTPHDEGSEVIASRDQRPWLFAHITDNKNKNPRVVLPWYLQISVNEGLKRSYSPARLLWDRHRKGLGLAITPTTLIGFLWLQCAKAIEGNISHRRCDDCGKWFALGGRSGRSDKRYCSGTCKARSHRMKKPRQSN